MATDQEAIVEYIFREDDDEFWIDVRVNRAPYGALGPFDTAEERQRAFDELIQMACSLGAREIPKEAQ
jgi:hypothetical protein